MPCNELNILDVLGSLMIFLLAYKFSAE